MAANRRSLVLEAAQAASDVRDEAGLDLTLPIDVFDLAAKLKVRVRFVAINMEGFYQKGSPARILLSSLRPLPRRTFTCAHELGHHRFEHGSTMDELKTDDRNDSESPNEIMANAFASFLLMPTIGIRRAFNARGWDVTTANPTQILTIASEFGVGYNTVLTHLSVMLRDLSIARKAELEKVTPQRIRKELLGENDLSGLAILDAHHQAKSIELEVGYGLAVPKGTLMDGKSLESMGRFPGFDVYRAAKRGLTNIKSSATFVEARIAPAKFVGYAPYRYLEDPDD
jgi:Zn-dependent peptidase ImmA (M78 family)